MANETKTKTDVALEPGWFVAVTLKPGTAPLRSYVGQIQAIDARGIRITLVDWISGRTANWDLYIPHSNLESALVATEQQDAKGFAGAAGTWQKEMQGKEKTAPKATDAAEA